MGVCALKSSTSLQTKLILASVLIIVISLGVAGVFTWMHTASFFADHETLIQEGREHHLILAELQQNKQTLFRDLTSIRLLVTVAGICALSITVAYVWRQRVSRPIALVRDRIHKMRLGTWNQPIPVEQQDDDEIGTLMREFNDLGPKLAFTAHQYAAASKLAAMALVGQRVVRPTMGARQRLLAVSESLSHLPQDDPFKRVAVEQIQLVAGELESIAADFDAEFQAEIARVGPANSSPKPKGNHQAA